MSGERDRDIMARGAVVALLACAMAGCDWDLLAIDPGPGELQGAWRVNESDSIVLEPDSPLVAHLRVRNQFSRRLRMVREVRPGIEGKPELDWKAYSKLPRFLEPGEEWEGVWLLTDSLGEGEYVITTKGTDVIDSSNATLEIRDEKLPAPVRTLNECVAARLTGEVEHVVKELSGEIDAGLAPPSTHLQLAELLQSVGDVDGGRRQYEIFADKVYGEESLPAWLRSKLSRNPNE